MLEQRNLGHRILNLSSKQDLKPIDLLKTSISRNKPFLGDLEANRNLEIVSSVASPDIITFEKSSVEPWSNFKRQSRVSNCDYSLFSLDMIFVIFTVFGVKKLLLNFSSMMTSSGVVGTADSRDWQTKTFVSITSFFSRIVFIGKRRMKSDRRIKKRTRAKVPDPK